MLIDIFRNRVQGTCQKCTPTSFRPPQVRLPIQSLLCKYISRELLFGADRQSVTAKHQLVQFNSAIRCSRAEDHHERAPDHVDLLKSSAEVECLLQFSTATVQRQFSVVDTGRQFRIITLTRDNSCVAEDAFPSLQLVNIHGILAGAILHYFSQLFTARIQFFFFENRLNLTFQPFLWFYNCKPFMHIS